MIDTLKAAYAYGLITKDEFDTRVSQTFASRTHAELAVVTADIPAGLAPAPPPPRPAPAKAGVPVAASPRPGERAVMATAVLTGLLFVAAFFANGPVAGLLGLGALGSALVSLRLAANHILGSRRDKNSGGQLPPQRTINTGPASRGVASAASAPLPHTGTPRRPSKADTSRRRPSRPQLSS